MSIIKRFTIHVAHSKTKKLIRDFVSFIKTTPKVTGPYPENV